MILSQAGMKKSSPGSPKRGRTKPFSQFFSISVTRVVYIGELFNPGGTFAKDPGGNAPLREYFVPNDVYPDFACQQNPEERVAQCSDCASNNEINRP